MALSDSGIVSYKSVDPAENDKETCNSSQNGEKLFV
jgi:hypothetical protein